MLKTIAAESKLDWENRVSSSKSAPGQPGKRKKKRKPDSEDEAAADDTAIEADTPVGDDGQSSSDDGDFDGQEAATPVEAFSGANLPRAGSTGSARSPGGQSQASRKSKQPLNRPSNRSPPASAKKKIRDEGAACVCASYYPLYFRLFLRCVPRY